MADTRAFLVGGPADGRVLLLDGSPLTFLVPQSRPFTVADGPGFVDPSPIEVFEYHRGQTTESDGVAVTVYTAEPPALPEFRDVRKFGAEYRVTHYNYEDEGAKDRVERTALHEVARLAMDEGYGITRRSVTWTPFVWGPGPDMDCEAREGEPVDFWVCRVTATGVALDG